MSHSNPAYQLQFFKCNSCIWLDYLPNVFTCIISNKLYTFLLYFVMSEYPRIILPPYCLTDGSPINLTICEVLNGSINSHLMCTVQTHCRDTCLNSQHKVVMIKYLLTEACWCLTICRPSIFNPKVHKLYVSRVQSRSDGLGWG